MNIIAYDIYKTFAKSSTCFKNSTFNLKLFKNRQCNNFLIYSLYGWSLPAIIAIITYIINVNTPIDSPYNPAFGKLICGISHHKAFFIYFMLPVSTILALNVILFIITAIKIKLTVNETRFATKSKANYNQLVLHIKLILVLGMTFLLWFVSMFANIPFLTYPSILVHGLHGVFIFVMFIVKNSVYVMIVSRINYLKGDNRNHISMRLNSSIEYTTKEIEEI